MLIRIQRWSVVAGVVVFPLLGCVSEVGEGTDDADDASTRTCASLRSDDVPGTDGPYATRVELKNVDSQPVYVWRHRYDRGPLAQVWADQIELTRLDAARHGLISCDDVVDGTARSHCGVDAPPVQDGAFKIGPGQSLQFDWADAGWEYVESQGQSCFEDEQGGCGRPSCSRWKVGEPGQRRLEIEVAATLECYADDCDCDATSGPCVVLDGQSGTLSDYNVIERTTAWPLDDTLRIELSAAP